MYSGFDNTRIDIFRIFDYKTYLEIKPALLTNCLLRPQIWSSSRASSGLEPCDVLFKYALGPTPCGCPVARSSLRSRDAVS